MMIILTEIFSKSLNGSVKQVEVGRIFSFYVREIVLFFRDRVTTLFFESFYTLPFLSCPFVSNSFELVFFFMLRIVNFWSFFHHLMQSLPLKVFVRIPSKTPYSIRLTHWRHMMVDGAEFWIICKQLKLLRKAGHLQIQRHLPSFCVNATSDLHTPKYGRLISNQIQSFWPDEFQCARSKGWKA